MKCEKCKQDKEVSEFYIIDGGLGYDNSYYQICKSCVEGFNVSNVKNKYYDEQITAQYFGAKMVISGVRLSEVAKKIDNGIKLSSNRAGIQNFLYLFGIEKGALANASTQMKRVFYKYNSI